MSRVTTVNENKEFTCPICGEIHFLDEEEYEEYLNGKSIFQECYTEYGYDSFYCELDGEFDSIYDNEW